MKPPIRLAIALPIGKPSDQSEDPEGGVALSGSDAPTVFLPSGPDYPAFLRKGYTGDVTFSVRVMSVDDEGLQLELLSMSVAPPPPGGRRPSESDRDANADFDKANGLDEED